MEKHCVGTSDFNFYLQFLCSVLKKKINNNLVLKQWVWQRVCIGKKGSFALFVLKINMVLNI